MSESVQDAFDKLNSRRHALLARQQDRGLSPAERLELREVNARYQAVVRALFPKPPSPRVASSAAESRQMDLWAEDHECRWCGAEHAGGPEQCAPVGGAGHDPAAHSAEKRLVRDPKGV